MSSTTTKLSAHTRLTNMLSFWKSYHAPKGDTIPFEIAVKSLSTQNPMIEARQDWPGRWIICDTGKKVKTATVFHTAAIWQWNSHLETGNYVPDGETAASGLPEARIQNTPSNLCQFDYAINTTFDKSIFAAQKELEKLVQACPGFNKGNKPRRWWQGGTEGQDGSFVFTSQVFVKSWKLRRDGTESVPYPLHQWIERATEDSDWKPNPDRPVIYDVVNSKLADITNGDPPFLKRGDIVWMSFYVHFIVGQNAWSPTFTPVEIIRVGRIPEELTDTIDASPGSRYLDEPEPLKRKLRAGDTFVMTFVDDPMVLDPPEDTGPPPSPSPSPSAASESTKVEDAMDGIEPLPVVVNVTKLDNDNDAESPAPSARAHSRLPHSPSITKEESDNADSLTIGSQAEEDAEETATERERSVAQTSTAAKRKAMDDSPLSDLPDEATEITVASKKKTVKGRAAGKGGKDGARPANKRSRKA